MTRHKTFVPILVRPGELTDHGLVASVAHYVCEANRIFSKEDQWSRWRRDGHAIIVRKAHHHVLDSLIDRGWMATGDRTVLVGGPVTAESCDKFVLDAKPEGWDCWGTAPSSFENQLSPHLLVNMTSQHIARSAEQQATHAVVTGMPSGPFRVVDV